MAGFIHFIKLLRPINLLVIVATMYAMRFLIIHPILAGQPIEMELQLPEWLFFCCVMVMACLAAAGNIINDYFDLKVDRINKPDRIIVGKSVKRRVAMISHHASNVLAVLLTGLLVWYTNQWLLIIVPVFMAGSLWYYSLIFKKQILIGNFVVALMVGIVPLWAGVFEINLLIKEYGTVISNPEFFFSQMWAWLLGYSLFAFVITLIREAQKDLEDLKGDTAGKFRTLPIVYGPSATKLYVGLMMFITLVGIFGIGNKLSPFHSSVATFWGALFIFIVLPLLVSWYFTAKGQGKKDYHLSSLLTKVAMAGGILFALVLSSMFNQ